MVECACEDETIFLRETIKREHGDKDERVQQLQKHNYNPFNFAFTGHTHCTGPFDLRESHSSSNLPDSSEPGHLRFGRGGWSCLSD